MTVELKTGEVYRGFLLSAEDNMNCQLSKVTLTARDGRVSKLEHVYLRGSQIRLFVLPDLLTNGPLFQKVQQIKANYDAAQAAKPGGSCWRPKSHARSLFLFCSLLHYGWILSTLHVVVAIELRRAQLLVRCASPLSRSQEVSYRPARGKMTSRHIVPCSARSFSLEPL